ncbi:hypothetical protein ACFX13_045641 [Malus domestica]|uniref:Uncharacterized protein n=1 Tax=Malus domestica TaxID=3750 RepID=A0A498J1A2_MALDO|nr:hypothetical protein DVH24_031715 [Malus domestica]
MPKTLLTATQNIATAASSSLSSTLFSDPPNPTLIATHSLLSPTTTRHLHHHRTCSLSSKQLNCSSNSRGFTLFARYSQAQDLYSSRLQDRFEDLPKLVDIQGIHVALLAQVHMALLGWSKVFRRLLGLVGSGLPMYQRLHTEIATAREPSTNATAVFANLVVDKKCR